MVYGALHKRTGPKHFLFALVALLFLSILVALLYVVLYGSFLKVRDIEINGTRSVSRDSLLASLSTRGVGNSKLLSWLGPDNILFWKFLPNSLSSANILPIVAEAVQNVDLGKRNVTVTIREREGFGTWCAKNGGPTPTVGGYGRASCYVFDESGIAFGTAPASEGVLITEVEDQNSREPLIGISLFPRSAWRNSFFGTLQILKDNGIPISKIIVRDFSLREFEVVSTLGFSFYFSLDFTPDNLNAVLNNLSKQLTLSSLSYLDFRVPNRVYYK
ncbi:MAG: hypothetical protein Q7R98_00490 [Candidatus Jorgensenbacteria bacterium]|nr:hypothetical protein [Candidatus Jorgensenbacteria bacterium]